MPLTNILKNEQIPIFILFRTDKLPKDGHHIAISDAIRTEFPGHDIIKRPEHITKMNNKINVLLIFLYLQ